MEELAACRLGDDGEIIEKTELRLEARLWRAIEDGALGVGEPAIDDRVGVCGR